MAVLSPDVFAKQPNEVKVYSLGFAGKMMSSELLSSVSSVGFEIVRGRHSLSEPAIDSSYLSSDSKSVTLVISGGSSLTLYRFFAVAVSDSGNTHESDGLLYVDDAKQY